MINPTEYYERPILIRTGEEFIYSTLRFNSKDERIENITTNRNKSPNEWFLKDILQIYPHLTYYKNRINPIKKLETIFLNSVHKISKDGFESGYESETINLNKIFYIMDIQNEDVTGSISKLIEHKNQILEEAIFRFQGIKIIGNGYKINEKYNNKTKQTEDFNRWINIQNVTKFGEKLTKSEQEFLKTYLTPGPKTLIINQLNLLRKPERILENYQY